MSMSLETISHRIEIQDLLTAYCTMIDRRDWDRMPEIFTSTAFIDYTASGGQAGNVESTLTFLRESLAMFPISQHLVGNLEVEIRGNSASVRAILHNPMIVGQGSESEVYLCGVWYLLELSHHNGSWKIETLKQELAYSLTPLGGNNSS